MLENTFIHLQGIGPKKEITLWNKGVLCWEDFLLSNDPNLSRTKKEFFQGRLQEARDKLQKDAAYFTERLPAHQQWRIFPHFRDRTAYLDIETAPWEGFENTITAITLYDGRDIRCYVNGDNLADFEIDIFEYDVLVTFNGKCFDVPVIERYFKTILPHAHIDLRYVLRGLGIKGGLKNCEKQLGMDRGDLDGVDGLFAVYLWYEYQNTGNAKALETLLAYNILDTVNLEMLMVEGYNRQVERTPFSKSHILPVPLPPALPFSPDPKIIEKVKMKYIHRSLPHNCRD